MTRYIIDDVNCDEKTLEDLESYGLEVCDARSMTRDLLTWNGWSTFEPERTLIIFPGNGASIVKRYILEEDEWFFSSWPYKRSPWAKRFWEPGSNPVANCNRIGDGVFIGISDVVVIDDVISSGETIRKLKKRNEHLLPLASWHAVTWMIQRSANLNGFASLFAVEHVGEKNRKVPINSLSTLIENFEIAQSYAMRNFGEMASKFLELVGGI